MKCTVRAMRTLRLTRLASFFLILSVFILCRLGYDRQLVTDTSGIVIPNLKAGPRHQSCKTALKIDRRALVTLLTEGGVREARVLLKSALRHAAG
jgi:hypothetical protein